MTDINTALASAGNNGHVFFPNGNYEVAGLTASYANQTWEFARGAFLKKADGNTAAMITLSSSGLRILGGDFDCNRSGAPAAAVFVDGTDKDFTMIGATVHGGSSWGVAIDNGLVHLEGNNFYNMAYAALIWRATTKDGADYRIGPTIRNNRIDRRSGYSASAGIIMRAVGSSIRYQAAIAEGNRIFMPATGDDTYDNVGIEMTESDYCKMIDNHVEGSRIAYSFGGSSRGTVEGNTAVAVGDYMIEIASGCSNMSVAGNSGTGLSIGNPGTGGCVITSGGNGNVVVGNRIGQGFPAAVFQDPSSASASPANVIANNA
ncbi:right-handed parallel beta-helix repeat-containing protein [Rhizobium leguminosarum]|uniref:right-handed parallel beta-helix repeat-containing protein n=1 Tax=Rhizobium leguminosarum TaxID=384 RepID=UPI001C8FF250|nr:right-handed parallel beta-helix repeat-containing protein [Rhizobium leguminosarum]MBY2921037.1 right-handed parallel beta-helix repeat-containing protein [Rhizobium leguminosarum]